jgi:hypothetical protein
VLTVGYEGPNQGLPSSKSAEQIGVTKSNADASNWGKTAFSLANAGGAKKEIPRSANSKPTTTTSNGFLVVPTAAPKKAKQQSL